ncbi:MAG: ATP-binding protein [Armatimonadetes bacterium]|nr:ATP-binding protein [Armatimonadota bacterium]
MRLRYRILLGYMVLFGLLLAALGVYSRSVVARHVTAQQRDALRTLSRVAADSLLGPNVLPAREVLQRRTRAFAQVARARVTVIAPDGVVLADSEHDPATMENHGLRPEVVAAHRDGWGWAVRHSTTLGIDMLYVAQADPAREYVVRLAKPLSEIEQLDTHLFYGLLVALVVATLAGLVASVRISGGLADSLTHLARVARAIGDGDLAARATVRAADEVGELATAINEMAARLQRDDTELAQRTTEVQAILRHMADGVLLVDSEGQLAMANPAAARMLHFDHDAALGRSVLYATNNYDLAEAVRRTLELGTVTEVEFVVRDGEERTIHAAVAPAEGQTGQGRWAVAVLRDLTRLRQLERVRQDFVASAGHELRTPVAAIRALAEALAAGAINDPEAGPAFVSQIVENTERLQRLVDDMMELARLEAVREEPKPLPLKPVVEKAVERLQPQAEAAGMHISVVVPEDLHVLGNEEDLETALVNLLDNAVKYAASGRSVEVEAYAADDEVHLRVVDHGRGIPLAERQRVFERFYRLDKARSRELGGTGLGLSIVKHAVEKMGGRTWVEETPGGGATFVIGLSPAS